MGGGSTKIIVKWDLEIPLCDTGDKDDRQDFRQLDAPINVQETCRVREVKGFGLAVVWGALFSIPGAQ